MLLGPSTALNAALRRAGEEAALRGDRRVGTDHLLLGLLHDDDVVRGLGVGLDAARDAARELDRTALATIGLDLGPLPAVHARASSGNLPLTSAARDAVARSGAVADVAGARRIEPLHLATALRERDEPDPAAVLLGALGLAGGGQAPGSGPRA